MVQAAYYRLETKNIKRSEGHSSVAAAAYRAGQKLYDERTGDTHDFSRKRFVYGSEILAPANAPSWVFDRQALWSACEKVEDSSTRRKEARPARELLLSFPAILSHEEKVQICRNFVQRECVAKGMIGDISFHDFTGPNAHNPHAHVLLTTRQITPEGFAGKERAWNQKKQLEEWRTKWADYLNRHFEQHGYDQRVDHRSYEAQGIQRLKEVHEGSANSGIRKRIEQGIRTETTQTIDYNNAVKEYNQLQQEIALLQQSIAVQEAQEKQQKDKRKQSQQQAERQVAKEQDNRQASETEQLQSPASVSQRPDNTPTTEKQDASALQQTAAELHLQAREEYSQITGEIVRNTLGTPAKEQTEDRSEPQQSATSATSPTDSTKNSPSKRKDDKPPREPYDRTYHAVKKQLNAMGGDGWFEVGIKNDDEQNGYFEEKRWHKDQILKIDPETGKAGILNYLKMENARGSHLYIRPAPHENGDSQGLILIDDLDPVMVEELTDKGLQPSLVVETSHKNCQAWVRISDRVNRSEATHLAKLLAKEAGGDPGSASYQHYGRLAGFTNRKEKYQDIYTGRYPWVMVREAKPQTASKAEEFLQRARQAVEIEKAQQEEAKRKRSELLKNDATGNELERAVKAFESIGASVEKKYGIKDPSSRDWVVIKRMAKRGYSVEALEYALYSSDGLEERKRGHVDDYVRRTVEKVTQEPDVLLALQQRQERQARRQQRQSAQTSPDVERVDASEHHLSEDERKLIEQWQYFKDKERDSDAPSLSNQQAAEQPARRKPESSPGRQNTKIRLSDYRIGDIPQSEVGELDTDAVRYIIEQTIQSDEAQKLMNKSLWALEQDTSRWRLRIKAEYLKERGRMLRFRPHYAISPASDAEIAFKLRLAGFSRKSIAQVIRSESPFYRALAKERYRQVYLEKGIAASVYHPRLYAKVREFQQRRIEQALKLPEEQRDSFIKENRLDKLNLHSRPDDKPPTKPSKKSGGKKSSKKPRGGKSHKNLNVDIEIEW